MQLSRNLTYVFSILLTTSLIIGKNKIAVKGGKTIGIALKTNKALTTLNMSIPEAH